MDDVVKVVRARSGKRYTCLKPSSVPSVPAPIEAEVPTGTGIVRLTPGADVIIAGHAGVPEKVKLLPGASGGGATYDLYVYGLFRIGDSGNTAWIAIPLYQGSVVGTLDMGDPRFSDVLATTDRLAGSITQDSDFPASRAVTVSAGASVGPAVVEVQTLGCPYLLLIASDAKGFVLVGGY